ncbi:MAG: DNA repair protein RecO [Flavobacteriaceae bacterium]|jgi:DNA repair protein RecO (recombination protein O)|nr:DNA repair protein RecO [Flavobacteriaceae bacterium]
MQIKTKALVLSSIRYQEKSLVVKCLTQEVGIQTFFVRNAFSKGKSAQKNAYFQPLTLIEIDFTHKNKGGMEYFKEVKLAHSYQSIFYDFTKNSIAIFLAEMLHNLIKEQDQDEQFFDFIETALLWFDTHDDAYNFHLIFLMELTKYLGFYPDIREKDALYFNSETGTFSTTYDLGCFDDYESILFKRLLDLKFQHDQKVFKGSERRILLNLLLKYYTQHVAKFKTPNSLEILKEIFST